MKKRLKFFDKSLLSIETDKGRLSLFGLAFPLFVEAITVHLINILQSVLSARYEGGFFVTPISVASQVMGMMGSIIALVSIGVSIILSINLGRKRYDDCKTIIGTGIIASILFSLVLITLCFFLRGPLLKLMGLDGAEYIEFMPHAKTYMGIAIWGYLIVSVTMILNATLRCYGYTKIGLYSGIITSSASVGVNALAMYVFKMPFNKAATIMPIISISLTLVSFLITLTYFLSKKIKLNFKFNFSWLKRIVSVGAPGAMSSIFYSLSSTITSIICLSLTPTAYLSKIYVGNVEFFIHQFGYAIGKAGAIMTGRMCGMKEFEKLDKMHRQNIKIVILINSSLALLFALLSRPLISLLYGASEEVLRYAFIIFFINIAVEIGRGMNHIGENGLNATGDVRFTTLVSILSCWGCSVGLSALFV
jgi:Na+-driven multidrug efflux pump